MIWDFISYIAASPSSFHAADQGAALLSAAGFSPVTETAKWNAEPGGHYMVRDGALMAWFVPETAGPKSGFRIIGAHTDSPGFKLKFNGNSTSFGFNQANVEVYGGPIIPSWFDRELVLAGQVYMADGSTKLVATPPLLRIPHLAIHLDRSANDSFSPDRQRHLMPIFGVDPTINLMDIIADAAGVAPDQILSHDLITADAQPGECFGVESQLVAAGRLDNLSSVFAGITALINAAQNIIVDGGGSEDVLVLACFDHEEVGSQSVTGAGGPILEDVLQRTAIQLGASPEEYKQMLRRSSCVSADAAHSIHPNYPSQHDHDNFPVLGNGPVLKINANQRYASTAVTQGIWLSACHNAGITSQVFVGNNTVPCGSTIGPITATRLGIPTVDVGIPLLSMHSARELCHATDLEQFTSALTTFLVN
ncbi:MAG: M18 family aminopeptidase [Corynebacterium sp.]|uniref:M18 family aminopeptidase n=1 Tax=Corynebacterium sp. TaxID=1720 RepID=UPI0026DCD5FD|nr:M18 family aminopeptidase [Corynebacterium sp.]MDO5098205.1 M18 family aminopeptidase [Corynebacterium sp.]